MKYIIATCAVLFATAAYAMTCTTHVVVQGNKIVTCQVCCSYGSCNTSCR